jgi:hypothetical protein
MIPLSLGQMALTAALVFIAHPAFSSAPQPTAGFRCSDGLREVSLQGRGCEFEFKERQSPDSSLIVWGRDFCCESDSNDSRVLSCNVPGDPTNMTISSRPQDDVFLIHATLQATPEETWPLIWEFKTKDCKSPKD